MVALTTSGRQLAHTSSLLSPDTNLRCVSVKHAATAQLAVAEAAQEPVGRKRSSNQPPAPQAAPSPTQGT